MAKAKKNLKKAGKKKNKGGKKKKTKGKKGKGKKKTQVPKTELEIKLAEQMMKRVKKKLRPMKTIQESFKKVMEWYERRSRRPVYAYNYTAQKKPTSPPIKERPSKSKEFSSIGELEAVHFIRRVTMEEKRRGEEEDSPIDVVTSKVKRCNYLRLSFEGLFDPERKTVITNTGIHIKGTLGGEILMSNGPLFGKYKMDHFHTHYGKEHNDGTEHSINGRRFALEMHIVFLPHSDNNDPTETSFTMTAKKAVLGLMFKMSHDPCYYDLFSVLDHINIKGKSLETSNNLLYDFRDVLSSSEYYNYSGGATDINLKEYEWMIFKSILPINKHQMLKLWDLRKSQDVKSNVKPTQPLGERTIFTPFYYDHQNCRGKEICDCHGHTQTFNPIKEIKPLPPITE